MAEKKENLTPEQRLQEALVPCTEWPYKLPENWCWTYINNICNLKNISSLQMGIYPYLEAKYLRGKIKPEYKNSGKFIKKDSKVILVDGENSGEVFTINEDGYMGSTFRLLSISSIIDNTYFEYYISLQREAFRSSKTGSAIPHLNKELFRTLPFPIAPLNEQQRIVDQIENLFSRLDEAKEKTQAALDSFESRKAAILHKAFTGELTDKWRKEHGIGKESWKNIPVNEVCYPRAGYAFNSKLFSNSGYQVIRMGNLFAGELDLNKNPVFYSEQYLDTKILQRALINDGDILITLTGTKYKQDYGYAVRIENPNHLLVNQRILCLTPININSLYLLYFFKSDIFRNIFFSKETGGVNQGNVSSKFVENILVPVPDEAEQIKIATILDSLLTKEQQAKEAAETVLEQIELIKKSILSRAFRGKLGTNDPNEESSVELLKEILAKKE